jgi:hypothetical protein
MATAVILNFFNPPKAATHYGGYSYCEVVLLRADFFKMAAVAMETAKMLKN